MDEIRKMVNKLIFLVAELHEHIVQLSGETDYLDSYYVEDRENKAHIAEACEEERLRAMMREIFDELYWQYEDLYRR